MRYYLGVDWADQAHAVWGVDESGQPVSPRTVPHTADGFSEWGCELDEWRGQGIELWAAIERPEGRVVDFLLDHGVVVFQHLQAQAGTVPVTQRSGKQLFVTFRYACDKQLRAVLDQVAFLSLQRSEWARAYYDAQRARGHRHRHALRALGAKWLKIIFVMWHRHVAYDESHHLATMARQALRHPEKKIA